MSGCKRDRPVLIGLFFHFNRVDILGGSMTNKYKITFLIIIILVFSVILTPFQTCLVVEPRNTEGKSAIISLKQFPTFSIRYTHSIHLSEVEEYYKKTENNYIQQTKLVYEDTAIGMPSNAEGEGDFIVRDDGKYMIENMKRTFPFIDIRVGQVVANHRFILNNNEYPLSQYFKKGTVIRLEIKKVSLWEKWKGVSVSGGG
jgi:hypothetical protein